MCSKRAVALITVIALMFSCVSVFSADYDGHWAYDYIDNLVKRSIVAGDENGNINPDASITRAEFAKVINLNFGYTDNNGNNFSDVASNKWYANDMAIAKTAGYYKGDENGLGNPDKPLTRNEAAVVFANILKLTDKAETGFNDNVDSWALDSALKLKKQGIISGDDKGNFNGRKNITRAQAFKMLVASGTNIGKTPEDVVSSGTLTPSAVQSRPSGGGGGGGGGGSAPSSTANPPAIKLVDTELKNIAWDVSGAGAVYTVVITRLTNGYNTVKTIAPVTDTFLNIGSALDELMAENKQITEKFSVVVMSNGMSSETEFSITNPAVRNPEISVLQEFNGEEETISLVWEKDENASSYELFVEFDGVYENISNSDGKAVIPSNLYEKIKGKHNIKISGISGNSDYLSTGVIETEIELPMFGGKEDEFNLIKNKRHFMNISENNTGKYKLGNDISLGEITPFSFGGVFNGNKHTITFNVDKPTEDNVGLFSTIFGGVYISDTTLEGSVRGNNNVGGFAGQSGATAAEAIISGAGIVNCTNKATIIANQLGAGIIGRAHDNSSNLMVLSGLKNYGKVDVATNGAGGITGLSGKIQIENSANFADIKGSLQVGGITGWAYTSFKSCYNTGKITGGSYVGGIAGQAIMAECFIMDCYNTGVIDSSAESAGGIAGYDSNGKSISGCYNTYPLRAGSAIVGTPNEKTSFSNCYTVASGGTPAEGVYVISESELTASETFSGFDFNAVWTMEGNPLYDYPELRANNHVVIPKNLSEPVISEITNSGSSVKVVYEKVENAIEYKISIYEGDTLLDEVTNPQDELTANLDKTSLIVGNVYKVCVTAVGRDGVYIDSSTERDYTHTPMALSKVTNVSSYYNSVSDTYSISFDASTNENASGYSVNVYESGNETPVYTYICNTKEETTIDFGNNIPLDKIYQIRIKTLSSNSDYNDSTDTVFELNTLFAGGNGSEEAPYKISAARHFMNIGSLADNNGVYYIQEEDINLGNYVPFDFNGIYNGNNYTITYALANSHYLGLFKTLKGNAEVSSINLAGSVYAWTTAAGIACDVEASSNVVVENIINNATIRSDNNAGGIVCNANFTSNPLIIRNCINNGEIKGNVSVSKNVAGILAYGKAEISGCVNNGKINGIASVTGTVGVGGILGANRTSGTIITNCYNTGIINAGGNAGGIIGAAGSSGSTPTVKYSYTLTSVPVGNIVGNGNISCTGVYYISDSETDAINSTIAIPVSDLLNKESYVGFDFDNVWDMGTEGPVLK